MLGSKFRRNFGKLILIRQVRMDVLNEKKVADISIVTVDPISGDEIKIHKARGNDKLYKLSEI